MSPATATAKPGLPENYYAPKYMVEVEGKALDAGTSADIRDVKIVMDIDNITSADLTLNNYDDSTFELKWTDSQQFAIGNRVHVQMGYADRLVSMFRGTIETLTPVFPADGTPTLGIRALDGLKALKDSWPPKDDKPYENKQDWQIVEAVAKRHGLTLETHDEGPVHKLVVQGKQDDLRFLKERAFRNGFELFIQTDPASGKSGLHFVKRDGRDAKPQIYVFGWGSMRSASKTLTPPSLSEFRPTITLANQVQSVTVHGWDPEAKKAISYTAEASTSEVSGAAKSGPGTAARTAGADAKKQAVVDSPVASVDEAKRLAEALLRDRAYAFVTGTGKTIGLPDLRPGNHVEINGVGSSFGGLYYVLKVTHSIGPSGYTTDFEVCRTHAEPAKAAAAP